MRKRKLHKKYIEYNGRRFHERAARDAYNVALDMMKRVAPGAVLDLAAGSGYTSARLADLGFEVTAYDINTEQFVPSEIPIKKVDLNNPLPEPERSVNGVLALEVIEHLENPKMFLREMGRVLKPGGSLVLSTPNVVSLESKIRFLFHEEMALFVNIKSRIRDPLNDEASGHISPLLPWLLRFFLEEAGFEIEAVVYTEKYGIRSKHLGRTLLLKATKKAPETE